MKLSNLFFPLLLYTFMSTGIFNSSYSKTNNFNYDAKNISNYFSGLVSFDDFEYKESKNFFKKLNNFEKTSPNYSAKLIQSYVNLEKYNEAYDYAKSIEKKKLSNFESNLLLGLFEFKKQNYDMAELYFNKLEPNFEHQLIYGILKSSLDNWTQIAKSRDKNNIELIDALPSDFKNFKIIQKTLASCYIADSNVEKEFNKMFKDEKYDFSRYNFFFASYFFNKKDILKAKEIINEASSNYPRNLLINQFQKVLDGKEKNKNEFNCKNAEHILAEMLYVIANALSATSNYQLSNFYTNLAKYLNPKFLSYESLLGENFLFLKKYDKARDYYKKLSDLGSTYHWYSSKQIAKILQIKEQKDKAIDFISKAYKNSDQNIYQTYDLANFLRGNEKYKKSIVLYSKILERITKNHEIYSKVLDKRGMAYERTDDWELAEKDLTMSLEIKPNEPYVMNYLAYSWVEKGKNIKQALTMLKKANNLKKNDGYITDSLGWALYKLENYLEAKDYLKLAIVLMPDDPVVNDHFADCLWMNEQKIQARYYWNYVLNLDSADEKLKERIQEKLLFGLEKI